MKKYLLLLCTFLVVGLSANAQEFSIGPKMGVSQANVSFSGSDFQVSDGKLGYHVGLFMRMGGNSLFVQPELLYTNTGGSFMRTVGIDFDSYDVSFDRVDLPVMLGFKFLGLLRVQAGPIASVLVNSRLSDTVSTLDNVDYKSATFGYQAGLGVDLGNFILDLKYENSLGNISNSILGVNTDQRQNQVVFSAGIRLF